MNLLWARPGAVAAGLGLTLLLIGAVSQVNGASVKEGQAAPDLDLPATQIGKVLPDAKNAKTLKLKDLQGKKNVVLYFFPKAMTKG